MCHHFKSVAELTAEERDEVLEEHSIEELRAEYTSEELKSLGIAV